MADSVQKRRERQARYRQRNAAAVSKRIAEWQKKQRRKKSVIVIAIKTAVGCACGVKDHRCLQFDHRDPNLKDLPVSVLMGSGYSVERMISEIKKCDVICANCHSIKHYEDGARNRNQKGSKYD